MAFGITTGVCPPGNGVVLLARVTNTLGVPITNATVASTSVVVTDLYTGLVLATLANVVTIFDSLQQNDTVRWRVDSAESPGPDGQWGYNAVAIIPASVNAGAYHLEGPFGSVIMNTLQAEMLFNFVSGQPVRRFFQWTPPTRGYAT